jgi:hypothetical protein
MRKATHDVVKPNPGVKNKEHVAREEQGKEAQDDPYERLDN